jgi:hypothetical protein
MPPLCNALSTSIQNGKWRVANPATHGCGRGWLSGPRPIESPTISGPADFAATESATAAADRDGEQPGTSAGGPGGFRPNNITTTIRSLTIARLDLRRQRRRQHRHRVSLLGVCSTNLIILSDIENLKFEFATSALCDISKFMGKECDRLRLATASTCSAHPYTKQVRCFANDEKSKLTS